MKTIISFAIFCSFIFCEVFSLENHDKNKQLKILHLTFHRGCEKEINAVAKELSIHVDTWFIPDLAPLSFDGTTKGNALYNIDHTRAERIWNLHKDEFNRYDAILTSDTAPLSRIFLQNGWKKPLIIWICNRFDYWDGASLDCHFPDKEYYQLFNKARYRPNVYVVAYNEFEHYYAKTKGVDTGTLTIKPCALNIPICTKSSIPSSVIKNETFFLPPYHNETNFKNLSQFLGELGIVNYCGRYNGANDLADFKGIIHLPYAWSNLAFFENISQGLPYFIPSIKFLEELIEEGNYFFPNLNSLYHDKLYSLTEWYSPDHKDIITYFDSWDDLKIKIEQTDFVSKKEEIKENAYLLQQTMLKRWKEIFNKISSKI